MCSVWDKFKFDLISPAILCDILWKACWRHFNERIMNWKQERARRIDISQPPFLIETISPASARETLSAIFFKQVPTSYAKISAFGVFRKRVITKSWGCPQAVWLSSPDDPRGIKSGLVYPAGWPPALKHRILKCVKRKPDSRGIWSDKTQCTTHKYEYMDTNTIHK